MGVVNVTPDSFSDGGAFSDADAAIAHGLRLAFEGADLLDIGGESTRPGAAAVSAGEEIGRVLPVIAGIHAADPSIRLSVDTSKAAVAAAALDAGADLRQRRHRAPRRPGHGGAGRRARRGRLPDAHARHAADDAGRGASTTTSSRTSRPSCTSGSRPRSPRASRSSASRSTPASASPRRSTTTSRCSTISGELTGPRPPDRPGHEPQVVPGQDHRPGDRRAHAGDARHGGHGAGARRGGLPRPRRRPGA